MKISIITITCSLLELIYCRNMGSQKKENKEKKKLSSLPVLTLALNLDLDK